MVTRGERLAQPGRIAVRRGPRDVAVQPHQERRPGVRLDEPDGWPFFGSLLLTTTGFTKARKGEAELEQEEQFLRRIDPAILPNFSRAIPALKAHDPEPDFIRALDLLISGLVAATASGPGTA
ncbi:hypothetical protein GCM10027598_62140 [Amycolatopsis oliviviridis]|uniref:Tetracycline repressor TetR C-terminal domain-containing protein n=1 Tax=Amycolatopsis oliviviridis TaxID=1471590 RepID=A0ABQ3M542_9PSEU|nr:hypothetical protein [Amycolatopsis oliviviridis]GHH32786.1 hypothetical protein GCM10017790_70430 [Amycolatopsis oliviviridis]